MGKYRKKPVVIEAHQLGGAVPGRMPSWLVAAILRGDIERGDETDKFSVKTLEGIMQARAGDWIIRGVKGELYPIKDDIFKETYEAVL